MLIAKSSVARSLEANWREELLFVLEQPQSDPITLSAPKQQSHFNLKDQLCRVTGVDLMKVAGLEVQTVQTIISEIGVDMSRWNTEKQFASWLGVSPDNRISGGKILKSGTRKVVNRAATALRLAAWSLIRSQGALGANFRRLRSKLGAPTRAAGCVVIPAIGFKLRGLWVIGNIILDARPNKNVHP